MRFTPPRTGIGIGIFSMLLAGFAAALVMPGASPAAQLKAKHPGKKAPGASFKDCPNCPEMVAVPAGSFSMGSPENEQGRDRYEGPQHTVTFAEPLAVGKFAVTFAQWDACVAGGGCGGYEPPDQGWGRGDQPVINVNWNDAKAYAAWLSSKTGKSYRLLSEAEREYITRAGTTSPFWWGPSIETDQANYDGTANGYNGGKKGEYRQKTLAVKSFLPNPWGLYQVHGNVWEWVEDCWNDSYDGAPANGEAWTAEDCSRRVLRGGSWGIAPGVLRAASRSSYFRTLRDAYTGFRVATAMGSR